MQTYDRTTGDEKDRIKEVLRAITKKPILDGLLLEGVAIGTASTAIAHGLGRLPRGWMLANGATATVAEAAASDNKFLHLIAGSALTNRKIWVF